MEHQCISWNKQQFCYINKMKGHKQMKYKIFDVVKLKDSNKATILNIVNKKKYFAEIVNESGETIDRKEITEDEIESQIV